MSARLHDYILLPQQLSILFDEYSILTHEVIDSYIYVCDVYTSGTTKKMNFICVHVKKYNESTVYSSSMDYYTFMGKCLLNNSIKSVKTKQKIT